PSELASLAPKTATDAPTGHLLTLDGPIRLLTENALPAIPALIVPLPNIQTFPADTRALFSFRFNAQSLVIWLDREYLTHTLLPLLADRYFPVHNSDYRFAV